MMKKLKKSKNIKALNKKAGFNYELKDDLEAGLVLTGPEIKAIRNGKINLTGSHIRIINGEAFLLGGQIQITGGDISRTRKLLLHKTQIARLAGQTNEKGLAIVPIKIYLKKGRAKVLIALGKGKKLWDKRESLKKKDLDREKRQK